METTNAYAPPTAELADANPDAQRSAYYVVGTTKLIVLSIATLNLYSLYWFYKHWQLQKLHAKLDCWPVVRAIFQIFFAPSLFGNIHEAAKMKGITPGWPALALSLFYVVLLIVSNVASNMLPEESLPLLVVFMAVFTPLVTLPLYLVQSTVNQITDADDANQRLTWVDWIFIVLGVLYWALMIIAVVFSA